MFACVWLYEHSPHNKNFTLSHYWCESTPNSSFRIYFLCICDKNTDQITGRCKDFCKMTQLQNIMHIQYVFIHFNQINRSVVVLMNMIEEKLIDELSVIWKKLTNNK